MVTPPTTTTVAAAGPAVTQRIYYEGEEGIMPGLQEEEEDDDGVPNTGNNGPLNSTEEDQQHRVPQSNGGDVGYGDERQPYCSTNSLLEVGGRQSPSTLATTLSSPRTSSSLSSSLTSSGTSAPSMASSATAAAAARRDQQRHLLESMSAHAYIMPPSTTSSQPRSSSSTAISEFDATPPATTSNTTTTTTSPPIHLLSMTPTAIQESRILSSTVEPAAASQQDRRQRQIAPPESYRLQKGNAKLQQRQQPSSRRHAIEQPRPGAYLVSGMSRASGGGRIPTTSVPAIVANDYPITVDGNTIDEQAPARGGRSSKRMKRSSHGTTILRSKHRFITAKIFSAVIVVIIVTVVVVATLAMKNKRRTKDGPTSDNSDLALFAHESYEFNQIRTILLEKYYKPYGRYYPELTINSMWLDRNSPQYKALYWLAYVDDKNQTTTTTLVSSSATTTTTSRSGTGTGEESSIRYMEHRLVQRYALAVLYYSTSTTINTNQSDEYYWYRSYQFLTPNHHECDWTRTSKSPRTTNSMVTDIVEQAKYQRGVICRTTHNTTDSRSVVGIVLGKYKNSDDLGKTIE